MLKTLAEDKIIGLEANRITFLTDNQAVKDPNILKAEAEQKYPGFRGTLGLMEHCAKHYDQALTGEIPAITVLYPDGSRNLLKHSTENTIEHSNRKLYKTLVTQIIAEIVSKSPAKTLRILEIGGGNGDLTWEIVSALERQNIEYHFTDIGKSFVIKAEREAAQRGFDFMQFGVFDISKDSSRQGYQAYSFDIIVGLNVVHATRSIAETTSHLNRLLIPNGLMFLIESVKSRRWIDMVWGLAEGWWYFDDDIRQDSPLLNLEAWEQVLQKQGFKHVKAFPQNAKKRAETDYGLIIAQQETGITGHDQAAWMTAADSDEKQNIPYQIQKIQALEALGSEVMVVSADVANLEQMQAVTNQEYVFLEVGPGNTLSTFVMQHPNASAEQVIVSSLRHHRDELDDQAVLLGTLGKLWIAGVNVDWNSFYGKEHRRRVLLPTYPFERKRYYTH